MTDEGPEERIDAGFVDRISESDSKDGVIDRSLISAPAWLMGGVTLFSVFVQSIIVSGGDIATAIRVIAIADRAKMLALAVCTVAVAVLPIALAYYWILSQSRIKDRRSRVIVGLLLNFIILLCLPTVLVVVSVILQGIAFYYKKNSAVKLMLSGFFAFFLAVSWILLPGLGWQTQVTYLDSGTPVVGPIVGETESGVAILDYGGRFKVIGEKRIKSSRGNEVKVPLVEYDTTSAPKVTLVAKNKLNGGEFCNGGDFRQDSFKPLYAILLRKSISSDISCVSLIDRWNAERSDGNEGHEFYLGN
ncbi:hypothetical protein HMPREF0059_00092 [Actinomyces viscosus C505]|jgi:hypothetical protein|uniref:Uncharacterized protein n=1 Tax=Actinomyces viscosus C505 TaxID=562973 RepID=F2UUJ5_ACTVI|nr:hypothetical protein [Actinomyces viscosus]EGE38748.1 hypothetical protein HMPREF0059_00092 [Actinomyces viscosus C505]